MSNTLELRKRCLNKKVELVHKDFDKERGMIVKYKPPFDGRCGYHTRLDGYLHQINENTEHAATIFFLEREDLYDDARSIIREVIKLQDTREDSPTFGLWAYYAEEGCDQMIAPDYNMADFNARYLAYLLKKKRELFSDELIEEMKTALFRAAQCSIKRNVSPDYTNISLMSLNTIICAGEMCGNEAFFERGKERLRKVHKYNTFCGALSEYNAPSYGPLALEEIGRMEFLLKDKECKALVSDLNRVAWKMLLKHYDFDMHQLAAPHMRCYDSVTGGAIDELIFMGTDGEYGEINEDNIYHVGFFIAPPVCPDDLKEKYIVNKIKKPFFVDELFYKKNSIRTPDEDTVIVRNIDSPDLRAFTYIDEGYSVGAFEKTDTWVQRRSSAVFWGNRDNVACLRMTCYNDEYEYCSGMIYTNQLNNVLLMHTGFVTDRGDFHYIIDKVKDGKLTTEKLLYLFKMEGNCENAVVTQDGSHFTVTDKNIRIDINITDAYFDGEPMTFRYNEDKKRIEAICFEGKKSVDFNIMDKPTYMVVTMTVNKDVDSPITTVSDGMVKSTLNVDGKTMVIESPASPLKYDDAIEKTKTSGR